MTFRNTKTKKSTTKKYRCVVKAEEKKPDENKAAKITAIKQEKASSLAATFSADVTGVTYGAIKVVRDETNAVVTVKSITVDKKDNTKAVIETYEALTDGKAYTVTYTAADGTESSAAFTATSGTVADIALNAYTVPANTPTEIKYQTLDANGVIIEEKGIGSSKSTNIDITVENPNGYQNNDELLLYKTGDVATVKAVYHTFKYNNTNGTEEGKVEKTFTITAVDQSTVIETYDYSVVEDTTAVVDFKRDTLVSQVAIGDDSNGKQPTVKFSFRTAAGKDITKSLDYTVSSGNENVLLASGTVADGAQLTPVGVGATYLVIKNAAGNVVTTLPITVVAKRALSTMTVDKSNVTVAETSDSAGKQKITVAVMDQYSKAYTNYTPAADAELKSSNNPGGLRVTAAPVAGTNKTAITIDSTGGATVGTYAYTLDLTDNGNDNNVKKVSFSVTVSKKLANETLALVMMDGDDVVSKIDTTVTADTFSATTLQPTIVKKSNGSITGKATASEVVSIGALKLTKNGVAVKNDPVIYGPTGGNTLVADLSNIANVFIKVTEGDGLAPGTAIKKNLEPGTYTVSFDATVLANATQKKQTFSTSFIVEDSQKVFEASVKKTTVTDHGTLPDMFNDSAYVKFAYAGTELDDSTYCQYAAAKYTNVNGNKMIKVDTVTMTVALPGTGSTPKYVQMKTDVNRAFTFTTGVVTQEMTDAANLAEAKACAEADLQIVKNAIRATSGSGLVTNVSTVSNSSITVVTSGQAVSVTSAAVTSHSAICTSGGGTIGTGVVTSEAAGDTVSIVYIITGSCTVADQTYDLPKETFTITYFKGASGWEIKS